MHDRDCLHRFVFEHYPIRGHLVHLDAAWRALIEHREYPQAIRDILGEAVAASLLLAATIKFEGVLSLQLQGEGPVHLLLAQCTSGLGVRGLARYRDRKAPAGRCGRLGAAGIGDLIGAGNLTVTLETDDGARRYQGIVPIAGIGWPIRCKYISRIPSSCRRDFGCMPTLRGPAACWCSGSQPAVAVRRVRPCAAVDDAWRRVQLIGDTLTPEELRTLADAEILRRLFNEDDLRLIRTLAGLFSLSLLARARRRHVAGFGRGGNAFGSGGARGSRSAL